MAAARRSYRYLLEQFSFFYLHFFELPLSDGSNKDLRTTLLPSVPQAGRVYADPTLRQSHQLERCNGVVLNH